LGIELDGLAYLFLKAHLGVIKMISNVERVIQKSLEDAKKEGRLDVAKQMILEGEDIEKIIRYTGLSREEIEKLK
jgi:hypothetical protein